MPFNRAQPLLRLLLLLTATPTLLHAQETHEHNSASSSEAIQEPQKSPDVGVIRFPKTHLVITGEVNKPVAIPFRKGITLFEAIASAGNKTDYGSFRSVIILREGKVFTQNLSKISNAPLPEFPLFAGDVIIVPKMKTEGLFGR